MFNSFVQANNQEVRTVINTALDIDGETKPLASKYVVLVNKQTPVVLYPIQYIKVCWLCWDKSWYIVNSFPAIAIVQSVNNQPYEKSFVVNTLLNGWAGDSSQCRDGMDNEPSCGLALDRDSEPIPDSQVGACIYQTKTITKSKIIRIMPPAGILLHVFVSGPGWCFDKQRLAQPRHQLQLLWVI